MNSSNEKFDKKVVSELNEEPNARGFLEKIPDISKLNIRKEYSTRDFTFKIKSIGIKDLKNYIEEKKISIVLITATEVERDTVLSNMEPFTNEERILKGNLEFFPLYLGRLGKYPIFLTKCEPGIYRPNSIIYSCLDIYQFSKPKIAILYGIAFGLNEEQNFGDVLISERIIPYEMRKYKENEDIDRSHRPECSESLKTRFKGNSNWKFELPNGELAKIFPGNFLSGEKLYDDLDRREELKRNFDEAIGGDMESAGFATAFMRHKVDWIVIKGVSDKGYNKGDKFQSLACDSAISLILSVFNDDYIFEHFGINPEK